MGKNQSASGLTNIIQYDNNGNVSFVSGSTTLMQISSSGAITTTGVISGSNALSASYALNSGLLNGTGSVGFATTGSLLTVSSSQQQISASQQQISSSLLALTASYNALSSSYTALSGSYNTFSGSNSEILTAVSSSNQQLSASYISLSGSYNTYSSSVSTRTTQIEQVYATTGSNSFRANQSITGSLVVSSTITAQTLVVQTVTSSILYSSGSNIFGNQLSNTQTFTGSVNITGSQTIYGNVLINYPSSTTTGNAFPRLGVSNTNATQQDYNISELYVSAGNGAVAGGLVASYSSTYPTSTPSVMLRNTGNGPLYFSVNGTIAMTITGSNVGINGATNSSRALQVTQTSGLSSAIRIIASSGTSGLLEFLGDGGSSQPTIGVTSASPNDFQFSVGGCKRMQIYSSGEVAIIGAAATEAAWGLIVNEANNNNLIIYGGGSGTATKGIILKTTTGTATVNALSLASTGAATFSSTVTATGQIIANAINGAISVSGTGYTSQPTNMVIGRYTSTIGYIQVPTNGNFEIWDGGTSAIAIFNATGKTTTLYGALTGTSATFSSSVHKLNIISLGGVFSTGTSGVACRSIETAYALASCRTSVTKGVQYANGSWYNLFYASQDVYMHYKILLTCASYFAVSAAASNAQDGTDRTFKVQYSYNNGGTWCDSFGATFGAGNGQGTGVISVDQSNAQLIGVRIGFCNGSGSTIIGFTCLSFQSCSLGMTIMNSLG